MAQHYTNNNPFGSPLDGLNYTADVNYKSNGTGLSYKVGSGTSYVNGAGGIGNFNSFQMPSSPAVNSAGITLGEGQDITVGGISLTKFMQTMQDRLSILQPDPAKLAKYEALRLAYENYKLLEKLLHEE